MPASPSQAQTHFHVADTASGDNPRSHQRILLVEDDKHVARYLRTALSTRGYQVELAGNGADALRALRRPALPDLILSDLCMPHVSGHELLVQVRQMDRCASIPFVVLSGSGTVNDRIVCLENGATDYISKPIDRDELAARVDVHLRRTQELGRLRREARVDELTGIANRRGLVESLNREMDRCRRNNSPMSVLAVDVDKFKRINDTYGHHVGDEVLQAISDKISEAIRLTDIAGRTGGDEFVVVLPNVGEHLATIIAERIRDRVSDLTVPGTADAISVSIGSTTSRNHDATLEELLENADQHMYSDKRRRSGVFAVPAVAAG